MRRVIAISWDTIGEIESFEYVRVLRKKEQWL